MADLPKPKVTIDGKEYDLADLSDEARAQVQSLQFVEAELWPGPTPWSPCCPPPRPVISGP